MVDLQECRREIDEIDDKILRLFEKRMQVCEDVAAYKIKTGKETYEENKDRLYSRALVKQSGKDKGSYPCGNGCCAF